MSFSPDGARLAVGSADVPIVYVLDGRVLSPLGTADLSNVSEASLSRVAWSRDGQTLFAGGRSFSSEVNKIYAWSSAGAGTRRAMQVASGAVSSLVPLLGNDLLVATTRRELMLLHTDGKTGWKHDSDTVEFRDQFDKLSTSSDGMIVEFALKALERSGRGLISGN